MTDSGKNMPRRATSWALVVYVLFLASLLIPVTALLGLLMAWLNQDDAEPWLKSHHRYQIRTMLTVLAVGIPGSFIFWYLSPSLGGALLLAAVLWLIARCIAGLIFLHQGNPHPNPSGWGFR